MTKKLAKLPSMERVKQYLHCLPLTQKFLDPLTSCKMNLIILYTVIMSEGIQILRINPVGGHTGDMVDFCLKLLSCHPSCQSSLTFVLLNPDIPCLCKQCRSRSVGFLRSQLIWICTVCHSVCEFISTVWIKEPDWLK